MTPIPGGAPTSASVDSEYRFTNVFRLPRMLPVVVVVPAARTKERDTRHARADFRRWARSAYLGCGGGWPHPVFIAVLVLELEVVPLVLWWHFRVIGINDGINDSRSEHR